MSQTHDTPRRPRFGNASSADDDAAGLQKRHSYSRLREVYLQKVHMMHPDKIAHHRNKQQKLKEDGTLKNDNNTSKDDHLQFIELKHAWEEYNTSVRIVQRRNDESSNKQYSGDDFWEEEDNFTMFGVGCSFADSEEERDLRNEIMEQACRGWLPSGSLSSHAGRENDDEEHDGTLDYRGNTADATQPPKKTFAHPHIKLSDDDMFICDDQPTKEDSSKRQFLVQNVDRFRRKR